MAIATSQLLDIPGLALELAQAIVLLIGIPFLVWQVSEQTKATRVSADSLRIASYLQLMENLTEVNRRVVDVEDLHDFFDEPYAGRTLPRTWPELDQKGRLHYVHLAELLSVAERAYFLRSRGWIDKVDFHAYQFLLEGLTTMPQFGAWWPTLRNHCRSDFADFVDHLLQQVGSDV
jgi:hypothetical protein